MTDAILTDAVQVNDGDWFVPSIPGQFGHGCCGCGLYHDVEYRIVDGEFQMRWVVNKSATGDLRKEQGRG
jgi:hypothetical protein